MYLLNKVVPYLKFSSRIISLLNYYSLPLLSNKQFINTVTAVFIHNYRMIRILNRVCTNTITNMISTKLLWTSKVSRLLQIRRLITMSPSNHYSIRDYYTKPRPLMLGLIISRQFVWTFGLTLFHF